MADLAAPRAAQEFHLTDGKRREVVVQHESLESLFLEQQVQPLHVFLRPQRKRGQRLGLAASEERGAVHAGQHPDFTGDLPDLVEGARVGTPVAMQDVVAEIAFAEPLERMRGQLAFVLVLLRNGFQDFLVQLGDAVIALFLRIFRGIERVVQPLAVLALDLARERFIERRGAPRSPSWG